MLDLQQYFIKEHAGLLKMTDTYDIYDPATKQIVGQAKEEISTLFKFLRLVVSKQLLPTTVVVKDLQGEVVLKIHRPFSLFRAKIQVHDHEGEMIGYFKSKLFSLGGGFWVYDAHDQQFAEVKGDWKGWNFRFLTPNGTELGLVTKKWAGLGKELFTSADNYIVSISDDLKDEVLPKRLLLAAALAIDVVFKEKNG